MISKAARITLGCIAAIVLSTAGATGAVAAESSPVIEESVEMHAVALTAESAIEYGFAVQTDAEGEQWAVAAGTADGDLSNAVHISADSSRGVINGPCGTAYVFLDSRTAMRTGYTIATPYGAPVSHTWSVSVYSLIDFESYDMGGLAPWGSQTWNGSRTINTQATNGQSVEALAGGTVLTSNGLCVSGSPTAKRPW